MSTGTTKARSRTPARLRLRGWVDVFNEAGKHFIADDCVGLAKQVAFSALLAFLPTVILVIGLLGLFGPGPFNSLKHFIGSVAPQSVIDIIDLAEKDAAHNRSGSVLALALAVVLAFWAATGAMSAVVKAVNRAYENAETRPIWKVRLVSLVLVLATGLVLVGTFLLIIFGGNLGDAIARRTPLDGGFKVFWNIARWPVAFIAVLLFLELIYYLAPNRESRTWRWLTPGAVVGSLAWLGLSGLFALYTSFSNSYNRTYGSLAGGIILVLWLYYSAWAILFGAELNSAVDRR